MQIYAAFIRTGLSLHALNRLFSQAAHEDYITDAFITCVEEAVLVQRWLCLLREGLGSPALVRVTSQPHFLCSHDIVCSKGRSPGRDPLLERVGSIWHLNSL